MHFHSDFRVLQNNSGIDDVKSCKASFCYDVHERETVI